MTGRYLTYGKPKRVRATCQCGKRYWTIRELHFGVANEDEDWISDSNNACKKCTVDWENRMAAEYREELGI
jgi:hypothetical protein